ncbi:MAG: glycosyl hydrolase-related protein [Spirochaetaceae bacterium]
MQFLKIISRAKQLIDTKILDLNISGAITEEPVPFLERKQLNYTEYKIGDTWGRLFSCGWFHLTGKVNVKTEQTLYLKLDMNCEALLFDTNGKPLKGFTNGSSTFGFIGSLGSPAKRYFPINDFISSDGNIDLWLDAGMNDLFGKVKRKGRIETVEIVTRDLDARTLYYDLKSLVPLKNASRTRDKSAYKKYNKGLNKINRLSNSNWIKDSLSITQDLLKTKSKDNHEISSIGHAHLDLAWLWPIRETYRKGARTFANALRLMDEYPDYKFGASQPQLYKWIKEQHPSLYEEVKQRVKEGRWEVQGGMWVEADTNVSGEEALVRQMLYGVKYFQDEFDIKVNSLWLPDVFGYSGNMPQIIKKSGLDYFMTIKLSWNDTNKFPHHTFNWEGIDGSTVFSHMPPEGEYNSPANVKYLLKSKENYKEKAISQKTLSLFGVGNGGGGPAASHLERIKRLNGTSPMPKVKIETSRDFFHKLKDIKDKFPSFAGELYLEKHRGTYTSQSRVKYYNRKLENRLKTVETLLIQMDSYNIYKNEIREIWQEVLLYQFHDILPGSSIKRVYDECIYKYEILDKRLEEITSTVLGTKILDDKDIINIDDIKVYNPLAEESVVDRYSDSEYQSLTISPLSSNIIDKVAYKKSLRKSVRVMENNFIKVNFKRDGSIKSIFDKEFNREVLRAPGNSFKVYTDIASAWDIFKFYKILPTYKMKLVKSEEFNYGTVQEIVQHYKYGKSRLTQKIRLKPDSRQIDFVLDVDWQNIRRMLRTSFPLTLKTDKAVFDIQFGNISRSTKNDTKQERAQYEACGHNWVDMSNKDWGASIITDSKYGFKTKNSILDLNLIKSTNYPCKSGDIGKHEIKYGLYVHNGNVTEAKVDNRAMNFNSWLPVYKDGETIINNLFTLSNNSITYSTVKESEDSNNLILRLYERNGLEESCKLTIKKPTNGIYETNMVEDNPELLTKESELTLNFSAFEVKTLKINLD